MEALRHQFPSNDFAILAIVLALPLLGAFVNGVFGKRLGKDAVRAMALSAVGGSFLASVLTFLMLPTLENGKPGKLAWTAWEWLTITGRGGRPINIEVAFSVDAMSATMMLVITGVGFLIHLYSSEYMKKDPGYYRFFAYLNLFIFSMLVLILGKNLAILFVGWEGVGLCSYLLIGFWFEEGKNAEAGKKAFIVNRIGDFGLLLAMAMLVYYIGSLDFGQIQSSARSLQTPVTVWPIGNLPTEAVWDAQYASSSVLPRFLVGWFLPESEIKVYASTLVGLALFLGCAGKSAQLPLYVWLPDAMAGPTPVSALIHAATMVTAGVYLVARMSAVFVLSPAAMAVVAVTGVLTALFAASIGLFQKDLKKVLAYSTVSQLGFMFIGVGVGAFTAGFFHVFTHAFFKACLFLGAGSVIHAMHARIHDTDQSQNMDNMGGLRKFMPVTHATFLVSCLAIAGVPPLSGFFSKDEILWRAFSTKPADPTITDMFVWPNGLGPAIYFLGIIAATMTAFYMFRAYFRTFWGDFRGWSIVRGWRDPHAAHGHDDHGHDDHGHHHHEEPGPSMKGPTPHESPWPMALPLVVLAVFAVGGGFLGAVPINVAPLLHKIEPLFAGATAAAQHGAEAAHGAHALPSYLVARDGIDPHGKLMWLMMAPSILVAGLGILGAYLIYVRAGGQPEAAFARNYPRFYKLIYDKWRIDELYEATVVGMVDALADIFLVVDKWIIDGILAKLSALVVAALGSVLRLFQAGRVQVYAAAMVAGLFGIGWYYATPHAAVSLDESNLRGGEVIATATPGLGYSYTWSGDGLPAPDKTNQNKQRIPVELGKTKDVVLTVKNAFGRETSTTFTVGRPPRGGGQRMTVIPVDGPAPNAPQPGRGAPPPGGAPPQPAQPQPGGAR